MVPIGVAAAPEIELLHEQAVHVAAPEAGVGPVGVAVLIDALITELCHLLVERRIGAVPLTRAELAPGPRARDRDVQLGRRVQLRCGQ